MFFDKTPANNKTLVTSGKQMFSCGHAETIGVRNTMEDASAIIGEFAGVGTQYFAVFDGHGGSNVSAFCANNLHLEISRNLKTEASVEKAIENAFKRANDAASKWPCEGCTAAIAIIIQNTIYCANVGDSRVILVENGHATRMTYDHKASDPTERDLVNQRGGVVINGRVNGILMVSRAIGDAELGDACSCQPYIKKSHRKDGMKMVIACDGVFDVMTDEDVAQIASSCSNTAEAARIIKDESIKRGSLDNVTCIVINLTPK
ncbi:protein phosphatase 2C [Histomonas meleagridis]|uniref:protein phosphatase 2C n=1 Tax=Histomonas meleagridis TaxID=135588 RepID=UPI00355A5C54|nr:protein phosphatase 2C [Histomonas meleagridis]KAH0796341.1 protein phosphatase 2C [Histomonas meleagridis]